MFENTPKGISEPGNSDSRDKKRFEPQDCNSDDHNPGNQNIGSDRSDNLASGRKFWPRIIAEVKHPASFFTLAILVAESIFITLGVKNVNYIGLALWLSFILIMSLIIYMAVMVIIRGDIDMFGRPLVSRIDKPKEEFICEVILSREALYKKARQIIKKTKKNILDTTWGPDPPKSSARESKAMNAYIGAKENALKRGVKYWEILTETPQRKERLDISTQLTKEKANYKIGLIKGNLYSPSMVDFLISDNMEIIFSHSDPKDPQIKNRYLYIKCEKVAGLFSGLFHECWHYSQNQNSANQAREHK